MNMTLFPRIKTLFYSLCFCIGIIFIPQAHADCFILKDFITNKILVEEGDCTKQASPFSTFKIPLALMGFESKVLETVHTPKVPYKPEYEQANSVSLESWKTAQTPMTWLKNSCIWYSQWITQKIGGKRLQHYVKLFNYGNQNLAGDPGKQNGLTHSWLGSSLKISPKEQIEFLTKMLRHDLYVSSSSIHLTRLITFITELDDKWELYGKTGSGYQVNLDGTRNKDRQIGWFVGWVENPHGGKRSVFAYYLEDKGPQKEVAGKRARAIAEAKLRDYFQISSEKKVENNTATDEGKKEKE